MKKRFSVFRILNLISVVGFLSLESSIGRKKEKAFIASAYASFLRLNTEIRLIVFVLLQFLLSALSMHNLQAAENSALSATSSDQLTITLNSNHLIRISNLDDIELQLNQSGAAEGYSPACIYSNGSGSYQITASSDQADGEFLLNNIQGNTLAYEVQFDDGHGLITLAPGEVLANRRNADTTSANCVGSGNNSVILIHVDAEKVQSAQPGRYTGKLLLLVSPE